MAGTKGRSGGDRSLGLDTTPEDGLPTKPKLDPEVSKKWDQLLEQLPKASLRKIDQHELKLLSELLAYADKLSDIVRGDPSDHASGRIFLNTCDRIHRLSGSFGLNPGDRKRLSLQADSEEDDPFAEWLDRFKNEVLQNADKRI
jgi:phage terminase small subunit